jgi:peptide/nickel transport system permease protein
MGELLALDTPVARETVELLRVRYGLDQPLYVRFWQWISGFPRGDFGISMLYPTIPVSQLVWERVGLTLLITLTSLVLSYLVAIPLGVYSATHKYSLLDNVFTFVAFIGLAAPNFLLALVLAYVAVAFLGMDTVRGLFSAQYVNAPWSPAKVWDMVQHLAIPVIVIATAGMASVLRIMRGNLIDVLGEPFVRTARSKGLRERTVLYKHAVRIAINPLISRIGMLLPRLLGAEIVTSIVLSIPTTGLLLYRALLAQDMYLAGTILLMLAVILVVGNLLADISLALVDPRIRLS